MRPMRRFLIAMCFSALPGAVFAQYYEAINLLKVVPLGGTTFEVIEGHGEGPRGIWCAAANFAERRLGAPGPARLYIRSGRGPSVSGAGRIGVVFTLDATTLTSSPVRSYSVNVTQPGLNLPVGHAIQFCKDYLLELNDF